MGFVRGPSADPWQDRAEQVGRIADRLRSMGVDRLGRADDSGSTLADDVHTWCVALAAAGATAAGRSVPAVPRLADSGSGDQWTVIATEYLATSRSAQDPTPGELIDEAMRALRRRL